MAANDTAIYRIVGEPAMSVVREYQAEREQRKAILEQVKADYGADGFVSLGHRVVGIFAHERPVGFKPTETESNPTGAPAWRANDKTKAGRAFIDRVSPANRLAEQREFAHRCFSGGGTHAVGQAFFLPCFGLHCGEAWIASKHKDADGEPLDGMEPMPLSEYYAIAERVKGRAGGMSETKPNNIIERIKR